MKRTGDEDFSPPLVMLGFEVKLEREEQEYGEEKFDIQIEVQNHLP